MKNKFQLFTLLLLSFTLFTFGACQMDDDDMVDPGNEQEVITTVQLTFTPEAGGTSETFVFSDTDGPGGQAPLVDQIMLDANVAYEFTVDFLDNSDPANPVFITDEVQEEAEEHLVCYGIAGSVPAPVIKDQDSNGDPLGLIASLQTGAAGNGTLTIILKHEAMKSMTMPCNTGETDVEALFTVVIQ